MNAPRPHVRPPAGTFAGPLLALCAALALCAPAAAEDCAARFARLTLHWMENPLPGVAHIVTEAKGQPRTENDMLFAGPGHYMVKMTEPAGAWYLTHGGATHQSDDGGKSWKKLYAFNQEETAAAGLATVRQQVSTVRNARCGEAEFGGETVDTLEAEMTNTVNATFEIRTKYWVRRADERAVRTETLMTGLGPETLTVQEWKAAPDLTLPVP
ncbi:MAG: hypothetical protein AB7L41_09020 [Flavobacteriaceae bacterium]